MVNAVSLNGNTWDVFYQTYLSNNVLYVSGSTDSGDPCANNHFFLAAYDANTLTLNKIMRTSLSGYESSWSSGGGQTGVCQPYYIDGRGLTKEGDYLYASMALSDSPAKLGLIKVRASDLTVVDSKSVSSAAAVSPGISSNTFINGNSVVNSCSASVGAFNGADAGAVSLGKDLATGTFNSDPSGYTYQDLNLVSDDTSFTGSAFSSLVEFGYPHPDPVPVNLLPTSVTDIFHAKSYTTAQ